MCVATLLHRRIQRRQSLCRSTSVPLSLTHFLPARVCSRARRSCGRRRSSSRVGGRSVMQVCTTRGGNCLLVVRLSTSVVGG